MTIALGLLLGGCSGGDGDEEEPVERGQVATSEESPDPAYCSRSSAAARAGDVVRVPRTGKNTTHQLGTRLTWTSRKGWRAPRSQPGNLVLEAANQPEPFTRGVLLFRNAGVLVDPNPSAVSVGEMEVDLDAFVEANPDVEATRRRGVIVGGADAEVVDLEVAEERYLIRGEGIVVPLRPQDVARLWVVDQGDQNPLLIFTNTTRKDAPWIDAVAARLVDSIELGDPTPLDIEKARACLDG